jgi:hypothetical protein
MPSCSRPRDGARAKQTCSSLRRARVRDETVATRSFPRPFPAPRGRAASARRRPQQHDGSLTLRGKPGSFFSTPGDVGSFTIEFWLQPAVTENEPYTELAVHAQRRLPRLSIRAADRLSQPSRWTSPISGRPEPGSKPRRPQPADPAAWSHHLVTYTRLPPARVPGRRSSEDIKYLTSTAASAASVSSRFGHPPTSTRAPILRLIDEFPRREGDGRDPSLEGKRSFRPISALGGRFENPADRPRRPELGPAANRRRVRRAAETGSAFFARAGTTSTSGRRLARVEAHRAAPASGPRRRYAQVAGELYPRRRGSRTPTLSS